MKKYVWGLVTGVFLAGTLVGLAQETFFQGKIVYLLSTKSSVLSQPFSTGKTVTQIVKGTPMIVVEEENDWLKVAITGYLLKSAVTGDINQLKGPALQASMIVLSDKASADTILGQLRGGADFAKLAKEKSADKVSGARGGDLGEFYPGDFAPAFEDAIKLLKPGQISEVVSLGGRYHIFKRIK